jgi:acetyl esterase/lipase
MKRIFLSCLFFLLSGSLPAMSSSARASDFFTDFPQHRYRIETVTYTPPGWPEAQQGDLYLPLKQKAPFATVLVVHGGSWQHGDRGDMSRIASALAVQGYAAFTIDYRLAPKYRHPAQLQDLEQASKWLQANASRYELDTRHYAAWGYSAGAHLVSLLAVQPPAAGVPRLSAVVSGGTPADLRIYPDSPSVKALLAARPAEAPALYAEASPLAQVRPGLPAFFLYHGSADDLVIPSQASNFAAALRQDHVPVELFWLQDYGHIRTAIFLGKTVPAALDFLARYVPPGAH